MNKTVDNASDIAELNHQFRNSASSENQIGIAAIAKKQNTCKNIISAKKKASNNHQNLFTNELRINFWLLDS